MLLFRIDGYVYAPIDFLGFGFEGVLGLGFKDV